MFCMLYVFFWVIPRFLNFICRRFGTLCLFHLHRQVGVEWLNLRIVGVSIREKIWLENSCSKRTRSYSVTLLPIGSGYFRAKPSPVWIPQQFSNLIILHLPAYEDGTVCSERSAYKIQTLVNYPPKKTYIFYDCLCSGAFRFVIKHKTI
jgi:hypothetical protein